MSKLLKVAGFLLVGGLLAFLPLRWLVARSSPMPEDLGVVNGCFQPCPDSPNCVSTQASTELHSIAPIAYDEDTAVAQQKILAILQTDPSMTLISQTPTYIHAEARSNLWQFVDDVEFFFDEADSLIQFRSASRLGYGDGNANRQRMEAIRKAYNATP
ncbi:MAG: DUF1499 domain-containing protein [Anaerolineales bacterium]|nr:DUF1499 domain-containing protein [Anaerolineales bacterium]